MLCADYGWRAWGDLLHSVRTGENAAVHALGTDVWEYRRAHPEHGKVFDAAMRTLSRATADDVLAAYDFARHRVVADIGGGTGAILAAILAVNPELRGIAPGVPNSSGLGDRASIVDSWWQSLWLRKPCGRGHRRHPCRRAGQPKQQKADRRVRSSAFAGRRTRFP
jgi:hypothetical protein